MKYHSVLLRAPDLKNSATDSFYPWPCENSFTNFDIQNFPALYSGSYSSGGITERRNVLDSNI